MLLFYLNLKLNLDSDTSTNDENLVITIGDTLIMAITNVILSEVVFAFSTNTLVFRISDIYYLEECINFKISFSGKLWNLISLYCSPSQSHDVFEKFADNFKLR